MSVQINKRNGMVESIIITDVDVKNIMDAMSVLIDKAQESGECIKDLQNRYKSLFHIMREY
jgi:hypothetical protein